MPPRVALGPTTSNQLHVCCVQRRVKVLLQTQDANPAILSGVFHG
jgi:hypothetical protein